MHVRSAVDAQSTLFEPACTARAGSLRDRSWDMWALAAWERDSELRGIHENLLGLSTRLKIERLPRGHPTACSRLREDVFSQKIPTTVPRWSQAHAMGQVLPEQAEFARLVRSALAGLYDP